LKKAGACSRQALVEAMGEVLCAVTSQDAGGWFSYCGYEIKAQPS
jgi:hypothetical protein